MGCTGSAPLEQPSAAVAVPETAVAPPTSTVQNPLQVPVRAPTPRPTNSGADNDAPSPLLNDDNGARAATEHDDDDDAVAVADATAPPLFALLRDDADTPSQAPGTSASVDVFERRSSTRALSRRASQRRPHHANFANPFALRSSDSDAPPPPTDLQQQPRPLSFCNVARLSLRRGADLSHDGNGDDFNRDPRPSTTTPINAWLAHLDVPSADAEEADAAGGTAEIASQH